jgi:hypothetical protein
VTIRLAHLGKDLHSRLKRFFDAPLTADATPLEIAQAVLDDVERQLQPTGRGRRVLPYNRLVLRVRPTGADRTTFEAAFGDFEARVRERLAELGCDPAESLQVKVAVLKKAPADWAPDRIYAIDYQVHSDVADASLSQSPPAVQITVLKGSAARKIYNFTDAVIAIGRTADPTADDGRGRRNRIVFLDVADGVTETVGRAHAQLRLDPRSRDYRLFDEGSSNGTSIVRDGATIPVPPRDPRGVRVRSGDEIQIGRAVLRFAVDR